MAGGALRPGRQADRFRQAGGGAHAAPDRRDFGIRQRCGGRTRQPPGNQLYRANPGRGNWRRSPVESLSRNRRSETGCGLHDYRNRKRLSRWCRTMTGREQLRQIVFAPDLEPGARNAVVSCLCIQPNEKVTLITDVACREIAAALAAELEKLGVVYNAWILEDLAPRPLVEMPRAVLDDMETSQVSPPRSLPSSKNSA